MKSISITLVSAALIGAIYMPQPADAKLAANRIALNRISLNRISLNRIALNRIALNGSALGAGAVTKVVQVALPSGEVLRR